MAVYITSIVMPCIISANDLLDKMEAEKQDNIYGKLRKDQEPFTDGQNLEVHGGQIPGAMAVYCSTRKQVDGFSGIPWHACVRL